MPSVSKTFNWGDRWRHKRFQRRCAQELPGPSLSSPGWSSSARAWRRRPTTSSPPSPWSTPSASCSMTRCSSAAPAPAPNTSASAPAGTTAAARWRCAGTAYDQSGELQTPCSLIGHFKRKAKPAFELNPMLKKHISCFFFSYEAAVELNPGSILSVTVYAHGIETPQSRKPQDWTSWGLSSEISDVPHKLTMPPICCERSLKATLQRHRCLDPPHLSGNCMIVSPAGFAPGPTLSSTRLVNE